MRRPCVPLLVLILIGAFRLAAFAATPGDALFVQAFTESQAAERLELEGKDAAALAKFQNAAKILGEISRQDPDYEPVVVEWRLKKCREGIARIEAGAQSQNQAAGVAERDSPDGDLPVAEEPFEPAGVTAAPVASQEKTSVFGRAGNSYRIPSPALQADPGLRAGSIEEEVADIIGRAALKALQDEVRKLRQTLQQADFRNRQSDEKLLLAQARFQSALTEVDRTKVLVVDLQSRLAQAQQALENSQQEALQAGKEKTRLAARVEQLEGKLVETDAALEVVEEHNESLFEKLDLAGKYIVASDAIREQLLGERETFAEKLAKEIKRGPTGQLKRFAAENETLKAERDKALERAKKAEESVLDAGRVASEKESLAGKLAAAEKQLAELGGSVAGKDSVIVELRGQLSSVNDEILSLQGQLGDERARIRSLEGQLADASKMASGRADQESLAEENALLKSIVMRQLRDQARRQQARKLLEEELDRLQVKSDSLVKRVDALAGGRVELTEAEKRILEQPMVAVENNGDDASLNIMMAVAKRPDSMQDPDLPPELLDRANKANASFKAGEIDEAAAIYGELVKARPESFYAWANLGVAQLELGKQKEAIAALSEALKTNPSSAFALTHLGIAHFREDDLSAARARLREALKADALNPLAHYYLGLTLHGEGLQDEAMKELQEAIELNPEYAAAHMNLALFYATAQPPLKEQARRHYDRAKSLGASPDTSIEKIIHQD